MKIAGMIGGLGPESTIDYYRSIVESYRKRQPDGSFPPLIINSIDMQKLLDFISSKRLPEAAAYLAAETRRLAAAGAEFGFISANTPHIVFDEVQRESPIPLISIVRATCDHARARGITRLAIFGTRFTMQGRFYPDVFSAAGISLVPPNEAEQAFIHQKYLEELVKGTFAPETRAEILRIARRLRSEEAIEAVILAGTELPPLLRDSEDAAVPFLDTTRIHVEAVVTALLE